MRRGGWILLLLLAGVVLIVVGSRDLASQDEPRTTPTAQTQSPRSSQGLPREAFETIALIESDGPFPYSRDGAVFMNRERLLPQRERGYWRECTVPTPGESDRGARRIVDPVQASAVVEVLRDASGQAGALAVIVRDELRVSEFDGLL